MMEWWAGPRAVGRRVEHDAPSPHVMLTVDRMVAASLKALWDNLVDVAA
jgi:hypothetical protein